ncbi:lysylphosphatidylglycerol synthase domain-containing protein [Gilvimarinus sp. SDUM040013]|uniref:Lysylphosphatidylglycerol synthase domain-containing protein n=1 Tax=Gilvimarinus gilvus TaxID=3058038 RepID=A0ABU4S1B3_9GAMM|nr:lysylphosphatidylglycerol synthase domain-containing protein [Gilvimarinus sp. SDUM040013]MDO3384661.1 lysylphosphatidylglycerol synthase domain-containing protein [Gilvimarinus sp. SDUM040013]MDX6850247.1 lysylphosphatidylglycerol synthase domain-containing protein [Gilvimarinus sp. SDUM040013]
MSVLARTVVQPLQNVASSVRDSNTWPVLKKLFTLAFFGLLAYLIGKQAMTIEWGKVLEAFRSNEPVTFVIAAALALCCFSAYASYDLIGRYLLGVKLHPAKTWLVSILSYAFNLNLSSLVGGVAFRYRLYSRFDVRASEVTKIIGISVATNWLGYLLLAGILFSSGQIDVPANWAISDQMLQALGVVFVVVVLAYLGLCVFRQGHEYRIKSLNVTVPSVRLAAVQLLLACLHWTLMASVIYTFFWGEVSFALVYAVLLVSAVAGAVTHIPGGLGVLEAVFVALLSAKLDKAQILGGLFAYRCVFYLLPLALATPVYLGLEASVGTRDKN